MNVSILGVQQDMKIQLVAKMKKVMDGCPEVVPRDRRKDGRIVVEERSRRKKVVEVSQREFK